MRETSQRREKQERTEWAPHEHAHEEAAQPRDGSWSRRPCVRTLMPIRLPACDTGLQEEVERLQLPRGAPGVPPVLGLQLRKAGGAENVDPPIRRARDTMPLIGAPGAIERRLLVRTRGERRGATLGRRGAAARPEQFLLEDDIDDFGRAAGRLVNHRRRSEASPAPHRAAHPRGERACTRYRRGRPHEHLHELFIHRTLGWQLLGTTHRSQGRRGRGRSSGRQTLEKPSELERLTINQNPAGSRLGALHPATFFAFRDKAVAREAPPNDCRRG